MIMIIYDMLTIEKLGLDIKTVWITVWIGWVSERQ